MPKAGYSLTATPGSSQAQTLQSFLASNLTTWTTSSVYAFGSGNYERDYIVLTHGTYEVLIYIPNGRYVDLDSGILNTSWYRGTSKIPSYQEQILGIAFSPTGGYTTAFGNGHDPSLSQEFWDAASSCQVIPMQYWYENGPECTLYFIENTDKAELFIYCGKSGVSNDGYGFWGVSSEMIVNDKIPVDTETNWRSEVVYRFDVGEGTGSPRGRSDHTMVHWDDTNGRYTRVADPDINYLSWMGDAQAPNPDTGFYESIRTVATTSLGNVSGHLNPQIFREFPQTTSTYGRKMSGVGTDEVFIHLHNVLLCPWASNLPEPPVV